MKQEWMTIVSQQEIAANIFEMKLSGELVQQMKQPGQFLHIKVPRNDLLLRRPISLAAIDLEAKVCTIIYRVEGDGTKVMSHLKTGDNLDILGPLGNGFDINQVKANEEILVVGGGIGVPPLYELGKQLAEKQAKVTFLFGFATDSAIFYREAFEQLGTLQISTDDGSYGQKGHVGVLLKQYLNENQPDAVYACGANGLLKLVDQTFSEHPRAYLSLESRMACGIGACYACVCHLQKDETKQKSKKVCDEGPVFPTGEVVI